MSLQSELWHKKYDPLIMEYLGKDYSGSSYGEGDLIFHISTYIFDKSGDFWEEGKLLKEKFLLEVNDGKIDGINVIKRIFPEYFERALNGFLEGNHDT